MKKTNKLSKIALIAAMLTTTITMGACSSSSDKAAIYAGDIEISDPFESTNRAVFAFNNTVDKNVINPVIKGYRAAVPTPARTGLHNFLTNLGAPIDFMNQLLQGDVSGAGTTLVRTTINSLLGIGGLIDLAGHEGIEHEDEDFGQTLATWGVGHGPYVVLPLIGPSSLRDYAGRLVDAYADPIRMHYDNVDEMHKYYTYAGATYFDLRNSLMDVMTELEASSIDYYATLRSAYYQNREAAVKDENSGSVSSEIPDYDDF